MWSFLASALMYPFHKLVLDPVLRPMPVRSALTRFGINGGVQQGITGCTIALQVHPSFVHIDLDLRNAHTFCSRDRVEEELESDILYQ